MMRPEEVFFIEGVRTSRRCFSLLNGASRGGSGTPIPPVSHQYSWRETGGSCERRKKKILFTCRAATTVLTLSISKIDGCLFWGSAGVWLPAAHQTFFFFLTTYEGVKRSLGSSGRALQVVPRTLHVTKGDLVFCCRGSRNLPELRRARSVASPQRHSCTGKRFYNVLLSVVFYCCSEPVCLLAIEFLFLSLFICWLLFLSCFVRHSVVVVNRGKCYPQCPN